MPRVKPYPAVKALIERGGKMLVLKTKADEETYWVLPGGKIEYGEKPEKALERELREEISCETEIGEAIGMYHFFQGPEDGGDHVVLTVFKADIGDQEIDITDNPADEGIVDYRWMEPEKLMQKSGNPSLVRLIKEEFHDLPKLVRNQIPEIASKNGDELKTRKIEGGNLEKFLRQKILEEAEEFRESGADEELADLLEAVDAYRAHEEIIEKEIEELREQKNEKRGDFSDGIVLEDIEE